MLSFLEPSHKCTHNWQLKLDMLLKSATEIFAFHWVHVCNGLKPVYNIIVIQIVPLLASHASVEGTEFPFEINKLILDRYPKGQV